MGDPIRVLVCGGREFGDEDRVFRALSRIEEDRGPITCIIHGGATGADSLAAEYANRNRIKAVRFEANWRKYGRRAGPYRNQRMIDEGKPDLVLAMPGGKGTADMVARARAHHIEVENG